MEFQYIYSCCDSSCKHIIGLTEDEMLNLAPYVQLKLYGIPVGIDEELVEETLDNPEKAVFIGNITGFLVLGNEIDRQGYSMYDVCDATSGDLEFVVSALMERCGPLYGEVLNHFYIDLIEIDDTSLLPEILTHLPDMIFTHCYVRPDIISAMPETLPHKQSIADKIQKDIAIMAYTDTLKHLNGEEAKDPRLVMSEEQLNIVLDRRNEGASYSEEFKDRKLWDALEASGFSEWRNTRVLYLYSDALYEDE